MTTPGTKADLPAPDVLILLAHALELGSLPSVLGPDAAAADLGRGDAAAEGALRGQVGANRVAVRIVGVGLAEAAVGAAAALVALRPRACLLLGSYGRYPAAAPDRADDTGVELLCPTAVTLLDAAVSAGEAAFPPPMPVQRPTDESLRVHLARSTGAVRAPLGVTSAITTDDGLAFRLSDGSEGAAHGENLEALGIALACERADVPFVALLGCTNEVGARGRAQWQQRHTTVARAVSDAALRWLETERV